MFESIDDVLARLRDENYLADRELATATYLAWRLHKPLLIEGEPGVGKTSLAVSLARAVGAELRTLQGHGAMAEGEWADFSQAKAPVSREFAVNHSPESSSDRPRSTILLLDDVHALGSEIAAAFVSFLRGIEAPGRDGEGQRAEAPLTILTATGVNSSPSLLRNVSLYHWLAYPTFEREMAILTRNVPALGASLASQVCNFVLPLRTEQFERPPGIGETIDLARALLALHHDTLDAETIDQTLGCIFKYPADIVRFRARRLATRRPNSSIDRAG